MAAGIIQRLTSDRENESFRLHVCSSSRLLATVRLCCISDKAPRQSYRTPGPHQGATGHATVTQDIMAPCCRHKVQTTHGPQMALGHQEGDRAKAGKQKESASVLESLGQQSIQGHLSCLPPIPPAAMIIPDLAGS